MSNPLTAIMARNVLVFEDAGLVRHYNPVSLDTVGAVVLDNSFNIYMGENFTDPESPAGPSNSSRYEFVEFIMPVIMVTKRDNAILDTIAVTLNELLGNLSDHTVGTFPREHLQIVEPVSISEGEPLGANAMKYIFKIQHHYRREDA